MNSWEYKCIGCGKKVPVVCTNCSRKEFKGKKIKILFGSNVLIVKREWILLVIIVSVGLILIRIISMQLPI